MATKLSKTAPQQYRVSVDGVEVGSVAWAWLPAVGYLWVARDTVKVRVGTGATRREAVEELLVSQPR